MQAIRLRTEHMNNPMGISMKQPYLSWVCKDGMKQSAYEISAMTGTEEIWNSKKVNTNRMNAQFTGKLKSRQQVVWKVRLWDENEEAGEWSESAVFEMGLLDQEDFQAKWINPEIMPIPDKHKPAGYLRKTFSTAFTGESRGRLYITCHGLYVAYLNGKQAGVIKAQTGEGIQPSLMVLTPGTSDYDQNLPYQVMDVTELLQDGENELMVVLGDGWYRGCSGVDGKQNMFGEDIALYCQLEIDGKAVCVSDERWQASNNGPIRENDMQQGEYYDATKEDITEWHEVKVEEFGTNQLTCSDTVPILERESFPGRIFQTPNGETVIDFGQNLAGYVEFMVNAHEGERIVLWHGECLDENGNFTNENFQPGERHMEGGIRQKITYICKEGLNRYKPSFTIMGFQYAKLETDVSLEDAVFTAHAVYSQMEELGRFTCSNEDINQLVHNSIWSQKSNFCDVPTDCPTRERAGWTGDAGVFVDTGLYLLDCYPVFRKWLGECRLIQKEDGKVCNIAPPNNKGSVFADMLSSSTGWGDASIIVPYTLYKRYGDIKILEENYEMMTRWYAFLLSRAGKAEQQSGRKENPYKKYMVDTGIDYGEWCEPGVNSAEMMGKGTGSVATAYLSWSGDLLAEIAGVLGRSEESVYYRNVSENAKKAYRYAFTENGRICSDRQCEYVRPLAFHLLNEEESIQAAADLNALVIKNEYHLNTGFLSTPFLCEMLVKYGYIETACRLLLQDTAPGWLYAVKKGANTIWETWDGIREDGTVHDSLNHYSYGVISGWFFRRVCGICVEMEERHSTGKVTLEPLPLPVLKYAKAEYESPLGCIESAWQYDGNKVCYEFVIPANVCAEVRLPDGRVEVISAGRHTYFGDEIYD